MKFDLFGIRARREARKKAAEELLKKRDQSMEEEAKRFEEAAAKRTKAEKEGRQEAIAKFPELFGFSIIDWERPQDWERFLVETKLREKAKTFKDACTKQEALMSQLKTDPSLEDVAEQFRLASEEVDKLKKEFWSRWNVANNIVRQTYCNLETYLQPLS